MQHGTVALRTLPADTKRQQRSKSQSQRYERIFDGYNAARTLLRRSLRRDVRRAGQRARPVQGHLRRACAVGRRRPRRPRRGAEPGVHRPGHHLLAVRSGAAVSAGSGPAGDLGRRVDAAGARHHPARQSARDVSRRHLRRPGDPARRRHPAPADHLLRALPPPGRRHRAAQRRAHPRRRHRPDPRREGHLAGPRGQPALAVGGVLRDGEPAHDGAGLSRTCSPPTGCAPSTTTRRTCCGRCATPRPPTRPTRRWWC